jgi:hypothetical protein
MTESIDPTDNLHTLHRQEEELREQSLSFIQSHENLRDHWALVSEAMNLFYAFSHDHEHGSGDELTLQYIGVRLFNAASASIKLAMSGYYHKAFDQVRDILETYFLLDYLLSHPEKIARWKASDKKQRIAHFGPGIIRTALDKRDEHTGGRKKIYDALSEHASHASYPGFGLLINTGNLIQPVFQ